MTAVRYISAIICFGLGIALVFAAVQSMYSSLGLGDNPGAPIAAGVGAMFLLGSYLLVRPRKIDRARIWDTNPREKLLPDWPARQNGGKADGARKRKKCIGDSLEGRSMRMAREPPIY